MVNRASLDKRPDEVATMFDDVAPKYDVVNDVLSMGQTRRWRKIVVDAMEVSKGQRVLDLAAGTGTSSEPYADAGIDVVACDFSLGMLKVGKRRRPDIDFIAGDATNLPFADNTFDATTISFGLRNVLVMMRQHYSRVSRGLPGAGTPSGGARRGWSAPSGTFETMSW